METIDVPCNRCDEFRQRFQEAGFVVLGCEPAVAPAMCTLRYKAPDAFAAQPGSVASAEVAAAAASSDGATALSTAAQLSPEPQLTPTQSATARAIVNLFETSQVLGDYGKVTVLANDKGRLTYGRSQTSLTSGNLFVLLKRYCDNPGARFAARLAPLLSAFATQAESLDGDERVHNLLRACADDRVMRETQDQFFDDTYWNPAVRTARIAGIASPLGLAVVYDSKVHGSWNKVRDLTNEASGTLAQLGERAWISAYADMRRTWLRDSSNPSLRATVYRMDSFRRLIEQGFWGLPLPLIVRDHEISAATLAATPNGCYDGPQPGTRVLALADPVARGLDVRLVQLGLSDRGMNIMADGIFGQTSKKRVSEYQIAHGLLPTGVADLALIADLTAT